MVIDLPEYLKETMHTWPKTIHTILNDRRPCTVDIVSSPIVLSHICFRFLRTENASSMFTAVPEIRWKYIEIRNCVDYWKKFSYMSWVELSIMFQSSSKILYKHINTRIKFFFIFINTSIPDSISILECSESGCNLALLTAYL